MSDPKEAGAALPLLNLFVLLPLSLAARASTLYLAWAWFSARYPTLPEPALTAILVGVSVIGLAHRVPVDRAVRKVGPEDLAAYYAAGILQSLFASALIWVLS